MSDKLAQFEFMDAIGKLIPFIYSQGYTLSPGAFKATTGHRDGSFHYRGLAGDLNLFKDGVWLTETKDHTFAGEYWKSLGGTWGGDWGDGNHYSWGEGR